MRLQKGDSDSVGKMARLVLQGINTEPRQQAATKGEPPRSRAVVRNQHDLRSTDALSSGITCQLRMTMGVTLLSTFAVLQFFLTLLHMPNIDTCLTHHLQ